LDSTRREDSPYLNDRRRTPRFQPPDSVVTRIGRGTGSLVDVSATGARIRHTGAVARGARMRITFEWNGERFEASGEVLASRVARIGAQETLYDTRVRFNALSHTASELLEEAILEAAV
jgi:hypothetical protein